MKLAYTEKFKVNQVEKKILYELCSISKRLYNCSLYLQRKYYRESEGKYLGSHKLYGLIKSEYSKIYRILNSWVGQNVIYMVDKDYQSFFAHLKVKKPEEIVCPPYYKKKGLAVINFAGPALKLEDNKLRLSLGNYFKNRYETKYLYVDFPNYLVGKEIKEVSIIPKGYSKYDVKFSYSEEVVKIETSPNNALGIDLGVNNFAACIATNGDAFLVSGKKLKAENQFYNKRKAEIQASIDNEKSVIKRMRLKGILTIFSRKRTKRIKDSLHKISFNIVKYCTQNRISKIVIGHNLEWKDEVNLGSRNNQNFVMLPHSKLISYIKYKAKKVGIIVEEIGEAYTSKVDSLALEPICKQIKYLGKRVKRGLFQSSIGKVLNADINGAINILRKSIGDSWIPRIISRGGVFLPWHVIKFNLNWV
jgi:IS605 OrfB family transposase